MRPSAQAAENRLPRHKIRRFRARFALVKTTGSRLWFIKQFPNHRFGYQRNVSTALTTTWRRWKAPSRIDDPGPPFRPRPSSSGLHYIVENNIHTFARRTDSFSTMEFGFTFDVSSNLCKRTKFFARWSSRSCCIPARLGL